MTDKSHEDLVVPLIAGPLDVDWATEGDEWEHHLHSRISEHFGGDASMHMSGIPLESPDYYEFSVTEPALRSRLRIVIEDTGSSAFLVSPRDVEEDERELWLEAVRAATERVGSEHPDFEWFSILANEPVHGGRAQALSAPAQISDLEVAPAGVPYWEYEMGKATLSSWGLKCSFPARVQGRDRGFDFSSASVKASRRVAVLRSLLSAAVDSRWRIKSSPLERKIRLPEIHPTSRVPPGGFFRQAPAKMDIPEWVNDAWIRLMDDQNLTDALAVYYEALDVWEHPSLALVCLVATIEGLGARIEPLRQCDCCEACTSTVGSGKRFRAALRLVLSKREAKPLIDAYQPRSETVHSGRLHGSEATAGALNFGLIQPNPSEDFESELLEDLRSAAREVLVLGLKGDIPCQVT